MITAPSQYFTDVRTQLDQVGASATLSADERDIVDDFEAQEFSASACAKHIVKQRGEAV